MSVGGCTKKKAPSRRRTGREIATRWWRRSDTRRRGGARRHGRTTRTKRRRIARHGRRRTVASRRRVDRVACRCAHACRHCAFEQFGGSHRGRHERCARVASLPMQIQVARVHVAFAAQIAFVRSVAVRIVDDTFRCSAAQSCWSRRCRRQRRRNVQHASWRRRSTQHTHIIQITIQLVLFNNKLFFFSSLKTIQLFPLINNKKNHIFTQKQKLTYQTSV